MKDAKLCFGIILMAIGMVARGQLYVVNSAGGYFGGPSYLGEYTTSGDTVNATLIQGLGLSWGMTWDGGDNLYVAQTSGVGQYTTSGATVNSSLISVAGEAEAVALDGKGHVFVYDALLHTIGEYTTSGATVNASFITGLPGNGFASMVCDGRYLFVCNSSGYDSEIEAYFASTGGLISTSFINLGPNPGATALALDGKGDLFVGYAPPGHDYTIGEFKTTGATVNASLISTGLNDPFGLAISGDYLFVANERAGTIGEFTTSGVPINTALVTGLNNPMGLVVVPEPSAAGMILLAGVAFVGFTPRKHSN
jgi:hypothetical protein